MTSPAAVTAAMGPFARLLAALAIVWGVAGSSATAQSTRVEQIEQEKARKAAQVQPPKRETGDVVVTKLERFFMPPPPAFRLTFGGFRAGAGLNAGVSYTTPAGRHALWTTGGGWSINNFKLAQSVLDLPELIGGRVRLRAMARWLDEPGLKFFGVGVFSTPSDEISYGLRSTDVGVEVAGRAGRWLGYGVGVGYLDARSSDGSESPSIGSRPASEIPGQGADATWLRTSVFAAVDTRRSPGYTNRGGLYSVSFHDYEDRGRAFGFTRTDVDLRQFVPLLQSNWIIALQARAQIAAPSSGDVVPFFMLPTVGGRDTLPGFEDHRFADRVSLLLRSELRWTASPLVDMAVFVDHGTVSPRLQDLRLADLQRGWGMGARLHSSTTTFLRIEAVKSVEGWRYNLAQGVSF